MNVSPRLNTPLGGDAAAGDAAAASARVASDYDTLLAYLAEHPVREPDAWLAGLARAAPTLAARVAAVRLAYGADEGGCGFEWDNLRRLAVEEMRAGNLAVMRGWAAGAVSGSGGGEAGGGGASADGGAA
jgi:hypothetical protein